MSFARDCCGRAPWNRDTFNGLRLKIGRSSVEDHQIILCGGNYEHDISWRGLEGFHFGLSLVHNEACEWWRSRCQCMSVQTKFVPSALEIRKHGSAKAAYMATDRICKHHNENVANLGLELLLPSLKKNLPCVLVGYSGGVASAARLVNELKALGFGVAGLIADAGVPGHSCQMDVPVALFYKANDKCWNGTEILNSWKGKCSDLYTVEYYRTRHSEYVGPKQIVECIEYWREMNT